MTNRDVKPGPVTADPRWAAQWSRGQRNRFQRQNLKERLLRWIEFEPNTGCWLWSGGERRGYGAITIDQKVFSAHRVSLRVFGGVDAGDQVVLHLCDVRRCCNPDHLRVGTLSDNTQDMLGKGRHKTRRGSSANHARLSEVDVRAIRRSGESTAELARYYGVSPTALWNARHGVTWKHVQ